MVISCVGLIITLFMTKKENKRLRYHIAALSNEPHLVLDQLDLEHSIYSTRDSRLQISGQIFPRNLSFENGAMIEASLVQVSTIDGKPTTARVCGEATKKLKPNRHQFLVDLKRTKELFPGYYQYKVTLKDGDEIICKGFTIAKFDDL